MIIRLATFIEDNLLDALNLITVTIDEALFMNFVCQTFACKSRIQLQSGCFGFVAGYLLLERRSMID
jgi:hypothetical protein